MQNLKEKINQLIEEFKVLMSEKENRIIAGVFLVFVFLSLAMITFASFQKQQTVQDYTKPVTEEQASEDQESPLASADPDNSPSPTASVNPTSTPKPSASPTPSPSPSPSPSPTATPRTPNPARFRIAFPSENQMVEVIKGRPMCVVDVPDGGDSKGGVMKRHRLNNGSWTDYAPHYTLCYTPNEGDNSVELQYKNAYGEEFNPGVRKFKYRTVYEITYTISAVAYADHNCNAVKDAGEAILTGEARVNITDRKTNTSISNYIDSDGSASYSSTFPDNETRHIEIDVIKIGDYKSNPNYDHNKAAFLFTKDTKPNFSVEIPNVPYADIGNCSN